jgi:hypothetical protein
MEKNNYTPGHAEGECHPFMASKVYITLTSTGFSHDGGREQSPEMAIEGRKKKSYQGEREGTYGQSRPGRKD